MRAFLTAAIIIATMSLAAGSLTPPPGPIAPTMKTLDQVEARTPITSASLPMIISAPGSYYLAENIDYDGDQSAAIIISSPDVTIDLNGYTLSTQTKLSGILGQSASANVTVKNGTLRGWPRPLNLDGPHATVTNLHVINGEQTGIRIKNGEVRNCVVTDCYFGISSSGDNDMLPTTISDCHVYNSQLYGIMLRNPGRVTNNVVVRSGTTGIEATSGRHSIIASNACYDNATTGIAVRSESARVLDNLVSDSPGGIYVRALSPHIENNTVALCTYGIDVVINGYVVRNTSTYSSNDFTFSPDTNHGPIVRLTGGPMPINTHPLANIIFD